MEEKVKVKWYYYRNRKTTFNIITKCDVPKEEVDKIGDYFNAYEFHQYVEDEMPRSCAEQLFSKSNIVVDEHTTVIPNFEECIR